MTGLHATGFDPSTRAGKRFELALESRRYEIDKFWSRATFFWAFVVAIAGAFGLAMQTPDAPHLPVVLGALGFVVSLCWSLAARGSKRWQESWEAYVGDLERELLGSTMFSVVREQRGRERSPVHRLFAARAFSVSRLAIAVADTVTLAWLGAVAAVVPWWPVSVGTFTIGVVVVTAVAVVIIILAARSTARPSDAPSASSSGR